MNKSTLFYLTLFILVFNVKLFATHKVDLSAAPQTRWTKIVNQYDKDSLRQYAASLNKAMIDTSYILASDWVRMQIMNYGWSESMETDPEWFLDIKAEIRGLAEALKNRLDGESVPGFREEDLFIINIGYDFSAYCTSGVYQTENGPILFRNLDWEGDQFKKFTLEIDFERDGQTIFRSVQFLGQVGTLTAMKPNGYAVALNFRKTPGSGTLGLEILNNIYQFAFKDGWSASFLLRYTLEHEQKYAEAKQKFETTQLLAPSYIIIGGVKDNEGAVIERDREINHTRDFTNPFESGKYLVQTNHDVPKPSNQDEEWAGNDVLLNESKGMGSVNRREIARAFLETIDESQLNTQLMNMLTLLWPVNNTLTIFTTLLNPSMNELECIIH